MVCLEECHELVTDEVIKDILERRARVYDYEIKYGFKTRNDSEIRLKTPNKSN